MSLSARLRQTFTSTLLIIIAPLAMPKKWGNLRSAWPTAGHMCAADGQQQDSLQRAWKRLGVLIKRASSARQCSIHRSVFLSHLNMKVTLYSKVLDLLVCLEALSACERCTTNFTLVAALSRFNVKHIIWHRELFWWF